MRKAPTRSLATLFTFLVASALTVTMAGRGCKSEPSPEAVVGEFLQAAIRRDRAGAFRLLAKQERDELAASALRTTQMVGGNHRYQPEELLYFDGHFEASQAKVRLRSQSANAATLEVTSLSHPPVTVNCVREAGEWKIILPR